MTYSIKITNTNVDDNVVPEVLDLSTISPTLITDPDTPYEEYSGDVSNKSTSVFIPLYKRSQFVELKAGSKLVIYTEDSDEAIYYSNMKLDGANIECDTVESTINATKSVSKGGSEEPTEPHFSYFMTMYPSISSACIFLYEENGIYTITKDMFYDGMVIYTVCLTPVKQLIVVPKPEDFQDIQSLNCCSIWMTADSDFIEPDIEKMDGEYELQKGDGMIYAYEIAARYKNDAIKMDIQCYVTDKEFKQCIIE